MISVSFRFGLTLRMGWIGGAPGCAFIDSRVAAGAGLDAVVGSITDRIPLSQFRQELTVPKPSSHSSPITPR